MIELIQAANQLTWPGAIAVIGVSLSAALAIFAFFLSIK